MVNETRSPRELRGLAIATHAKISQKGREFKVPSQSGDGFYTVLRVRDEFHCTCMDYDLRGERCKHGFAVEFWLQRETTPWGQIVETRAARVTYGQNWTAYNRAQTSEKAEFCTLLRDLVASVEQPEQKRGRPSLPLSDMLFAAGYKVYSTVSARRFMTDLKAAADAGMISKVPHYNSIFNVLDRESLTPILQDLITRSALPLQSVETKFAVDSTGLGTQCFYRHYSAKYGQSNERRNYLKVHAMVGVKTNVITSVKVTERYMNDSPELPALVADTAKNFTVEQVAADKAYCGVQNFEAIDAVGATPFVPFKSSARGVSASPLFNKLFHFFQMNQDEFMPKYHTRSNVESTFSAMKRKFGETIRSKAPTAQKNEALLKVLCHNLVCLIHEMHETGAPVAFPSARGERIA